MTWRLNTNNSYLCWVFFFWPSSFTLPLFPGLDFGDWISRPLCPLGFSWFQPMEDYVMRTMRWKIMQKIREERRWRCLCTWLLPYHGLAASSHLRPCSDSPLSNPLQPPLSPFDQEAVMFPALASPRCFTVLRWKKGIQFTSFKQFLYLSMT